MDSYSEFIFEPLGKDTKCIEKIKYECPLIFSAFCRKEALYQRQEIMKNLQMHFSTVDSQWYIKLIFSNKYNNIEFIFYIIKICLIIKREKLLKVFLFNKKAFMISNLFSFLKAHFGENRHEKNSLIYKKIVFWLPLQFFNR